MSWLWTYMKGKRPAFVTGLALSALTSSMVILNPMLAQKLIDDVILPRDTRPLLPILALMMAVQITRLGLRYFMVILMERFGLDAMSGIRRDMYTTVQNQDYRFWGRFPTGNLMTRMTGDLDHLRHTAAWVSYQITDAIVMFIATFTFFVLVNWRLALCLTVVLPFILFISWRFMDRLRPRLHLLRERLTALSTAVTENIGGNRIVKAFAREEHEKKHFEDFNAAFRDTSCDNALLAARYQPLLDIASQSLVIIILAAGGILLIRGQMSGGQYMAFSAISWALAAPLRMMGPLLADIERYRVASEMIREVVDAPPGIGDAPDSTELAGRPAGKIEFKDVCLSINGTPVLEHINFTAGPGQTIGILGSTGAGKTSLVNVLCRFYEPTLGEVLLDGVDIRRYTLSSLRRNIGLAMQDVFLFSDSVQGNIAYGNPELDDETIRKRAAQAGADEFAGGLPEAYQTIVGERGVGLSGGQRQRIALARALAVRPAILVLDDTMSAVDSETEQYIRAQIDNLDFPCTKIIIAQRVSSFKGADCILVMDRGHIIEQGTHNELIGLRGFYYHIWALQRGASEQGGENYNAAE